MQLCCVPSEGVANSFSEFGEAGVSAPLELWRSRRDAGLPPKLCAGNASRPPRYNVRIRTSPGLRVRCQMRRDQKNLKTSDEIASI